MSSMTGSITPSPGPFRTKGRTWSPWAQRAGLHLRLGNRVFLALLLAGCGQKEERAGAPGQVAAPVRSRVIQEEKDHPMAWDLDTADEAPFIFDADLNPWPPQSSRPTRIAAHAFLDRPGGFKGQVWYRLVKTGEWKPMQQLQAREKDGTVAFEAEDTLPRGSVAVHFRLQVAGDAVPYELTDWEVNVR